VGVIVLVVLLTRSLFTVGAGEVGVVFDPLGGGVQPSEAQEGLNVKPPWASVAKYNTKTQDYTMSGVIEEGQIQRADRINTVTSEGLYVGLDITVLFRIDSTKADEIRRKIGLEGEYQQIVVRPAIRSTIREIVSNHTAADIYGEGRATVEAEIYEKLASNLQTRSINVEQILLREVELPAEITRAIEAKKQAEQEALRMQYVLEKEKLEKERKLIEADGIAGANKIIADSLSREYLAWYWIDNLDEHESVVYMVPSESGVPLFKDIDSIIGGGMSEQEGEDVISEAESETSEPIEGTDGEGDAGNGTSTE
jgi:regulator of protease activity HflC (stomatin/prohibitin superfamily)